MLSKLEAIVVLEYPTDHGLPCLLMRGSDGDPEAFLSFSPRSCCVDGIDPDIAPSVSCPPSAAPENFDEAATNFGKIIYN